MLQLATACPGFSQPTGRHKGIVELGSTPVVGNFKAVRHPRVRHTLYSLTLAPSLKVDPNLSGRGMLGLIQTSSRFVLWAAGDSNG